MSCDKLPWFLLAMLCVTVIVAIQLASASEYDHACRPAPAAPHMLCTSGKNIRCHPVRRTCLCIEPPAPLNETHVYRWDKQADKCVLLRKEDVGQYEWCARLHFKLKGTFPGGDPVCKLDEECQKTPLGQYSQCNLDRCACACVKVHSLDLRGYERNVTKFEGQCQVEKLLDDFCELPEECRSVKGGAICSNDKCACDPATFVRVGSKCASRVLALETEPCEYAEQCQALNANATCHKMRKVCMCENGTSASGNKCVVPRGFNELCGEDADCQAGIGENALCFEDVAKNQTSDLVEVKICACGTKFVFDNVTRLCVEAEVSTTETEVMAASTVTETEPTIPSSTGSPSQDPDPVNTLEPQPPPTPLPSQNVSAPAPIPGPDPGDTTMVDWAKPTIIICTAFIVTILVTGLLVAYSNWNRIRLMRDMELQRQQGASSKEPLLLRELGPGLDLPEDDFEIDRGQVLGSGRNGIVYVGYFRPRALQVAVKTNRELASSEIYLRAILEEAKVLSYLGQHTNVVQFYGICQATVRTGHVYLLCELCPLGSLEAFLREKRKMFDFSKHATYQATAASKGGLGLALVIPLTSSSSRPGSEDRSDYRASTLIAESRASSSSPDSGAAAKLGHDHLYTWAHQIASAMEFVSARKVIHSDLATRNVLLASLDCVKLTDFGLSRRLYDNYTYMKTGPDPLPWKWLDHDALRFLMFTTWTDVWSFGICMWEMWTLGEVPYPGIVTPQCQDFMTQLLHGLHPSRPEAASDELYGVMVQCWNPSKMERPTFSWLKEALAGLMKKEGYRHPAEKVLKEELDGFGYLLPR